MEVWQKTTKFYKAIIFNLKINYLKKKEFAKPAFSQLLRKSHLWVPHLNMESTRQNLYSTSGGWMRKSGKQERVPLCGWKAAIPFSRGSSWPRDRTLVSYITAIFFTIWATREVHNFVMQRSDWSKEVTIPITLLVNVAQMALCVCVQLCLSLCNSMDSSVHGIFQARSGIFGVGCHFLLQGNLPNSGIEPLSPAFPGGFFTTVPPGKS